MLKYTRVSGDKKAIVKNKTKKEKLRKKKLIEKISRFDSMKLIFFFQLFTGASGIRKKPVALWRNVKWGRSTSNTDRVSSEWRDIGNNVASAGNFECGRTGPNPRKCKYRTYFFSFYNFLIIINQSCDLAVKSKREKNKKIK